MGETPDAARRGARDRGVMTTIDHTSVAAGLRACGFVGRIVEPTDPEYDTARAGWNGAIDRHPAAVAYATDADDVAAAIRAARADGLPFTVRAGAHSVSGRSIRDGALCIDLRALNRVEVDPESAIVRVGGGALLGELDAATQEHGLAVPAGQVSHTGVGGLTLGGGIGWLMRRHGLTIDSLRAVEVVLADGQQVRASAAEHPDLFWALRGGGGDFGVVTRFEFQAHRVGPMVLAGVLVYPWDRAREAFRASRELMDGAPEELTLFDVLLTAPPAEPFPPELQGQRVAVIGVAWCGELEDGERVLAPLRASCPPALDLVGPMPYVALQSMLDATAPHGWHFYDRQHYLRDVSDDFIDTLVDGFESVPTPQAHVVTSWLGGAVDRVPPGETAFGHRGAKALTWIIGCSVDDPVDPVRDWVRRVWDDTAEVRDGRRLRQRTRRRPAGSRRLRGRRLGPARRGQAPLRPGRRVLRQRDRRSMMAQRSFATATAPALRATRSMPWRTACAAASARLRTPSFASTRPTWCSAVFGAITSRSAISAFDSPAATRPRTSRSRAVSSSRSPRVAVRPATPSSRSRAAARSASARAPSSSKESRAVRAVESCEGRAACRLDAREGQARPGGLERELQRREADDGVLQRIRGRSEVAIGGGRAPVEESCLGGEVSSTCRRGDVVQPLRGRCRLVDVAGCERERPAEDEEHTLVDIRPPVEQRVRVRGVAALERQLHEGRDGSGLVVEPVEEHRGVLHPPLPQTKPGEHGERQRPSSLLAAVGRAVRGLRRERRRRAPSLLRGRGHRRRSRDTTTGRG